MRIWLLGLFVGLVANVCAQSPLYHNFANTSLVEVIKKISVTYDLKFSYDPKLLNNYLVNKEINAANPKDLVNQLIEDFPFTIHHSKDIQIIVPKHSDAIIGQIRDKETGDPLPFAHVKSKKRGTISNLDGNFKLPIENNDSLQLEISYIGYKKLNFKVSSLTANNVVLTMEQDAQSLNEVTLNAPKWTDININPGAVSISSDEFSLIPSFNVTDAIKSLQLMPGINATDESSSGLNIRGNRSIHNLVLMDGFTLYHLDHVFGLFSSLNSNGIKSINIFKGGFVSKYGGRVSSVVDIESNSESDIEETVGVGFSLLSADVYFSTPITKKISLFFSGRQSSTNILNSKTYNNFLRSVRNNHLTTILNAPYANNFRPHINFYDVSSKLQYDINDRFTLEASFYRGKDNYEGSSEESFSDSVISNTSQIFDQSVWNNYGFSLTMNAQLSKSWYSKTTLSRSAYTKYDYFLTAITFSDSVIVDPNLGIYPAAINLPKSGNETSVRPNVPLNIFEYNRRNRIDDITLKSDHRILLSKTKDKYKIINAGVEFSSIFSQFSNDREILIDGDVPFSNFTLDIESYTASLYGNYEFAHKNWTSNMGLRSTYYQNTNKIYLEPRLGLNYIANQHLSFRGAMTYHYQFINQAPVNYNESKQTPYWTIANDIEISVMNSLHLIVGSRFYHKKWIFDIEFYRKLTDGIVSHQFFDFSLLPEIDAIRSERDFGAQLHGSNVAQGMDFLVKYSTQQHHFWLSYSLSKTQNKFWYLNDNQFFPSALDQRHEINFTHNFKIKKWEFSTLFIYGSGKPFTLPNTTSGQTGFSYDLNRLNRERLPHYHRLDGTVKYHFSIGKKINTEVGMILFNLTGKQNLKYRQFFADYIIPYDDTASFISEESGDVEPTIVQIDTYLLGFTPNFFINFTF